MCRWNKYTFHDVSSLITKGMFSFIIPSYHFSSQPNLQFRQQTHFLGMPLLLRGYLFAIRSVSSKYSLELQLRIQRGVGMGAQEVRANPH